jgi:phage-related protein/predicted XRE-type DNA-binding protein
MDIKNRKDNANEATVLGGEQQKDLQSLPEDVQDVFGYALHLAQDGGKHPQAKPLKGFGGAGVLEVVEDYCTDTYRAVYTLKFRQAVYVLHAFQKKSSSGMQTPKSDIEKFENVLRQQKPMPEEHNMSQNIDISSGNVYADIGLDNADEMQVKAQLATTIGNIIKSRRLTQVEAAKLLGMTQPRLSNMLRGQFRGISEVKMLECLTRLGRDVQIVVGRPRRTPGRMKVVFA